MVRDNGIGIMPEDQHLLFQMFGKLKRTAEMNSEGIGLGLTIVKQLVNFYKGRIEVYSAGRGRGATFMFSMKARLAS